ncbi:hypothetical protein DFJ73DRAFT_841672 [Zopfochytrium polystomum]|nr:hypothetical protein DFJ73DRAFT_841672 [Zopfochytrium polystomum]
MKLRNKRKPPQTQICQKQLGEIRKEDIHLVRRNHSIEAPSTLSHHSNRNAFLYFNAHHRKCSHSPSSPTSALWTHIFACPDPVAVKTEYRSSDAFFRGLCFSGAIFLYFISLSESIKNQLDPYCDFLKVVLRSQTECSSVRKKVSRFLVVFSVSIHQFLNRAFGPYDRL